MTKRRQIFKFSVSPLYKSIQCMLEFEFKKGLLVVQGTGDLCMDELTSRALRLSKHPLYEPTDNVLIDLRLMNSTDLYAARLRSLVHAESEAELQRKVAIVASKDHMYGQARMFQSMASELVSEYRVFRDYYVALAWLLRKETPARRVNMKQLRSANSGSLD